jgi:cytochrome c oxidase subunit 2
MVDSRMVLTGQTIAYTLYVLAILALMGWFAYRVTRAGDTGGVRPALFWSFVGCLVVIGVSLHIITYNTIPWVPLDLHRGSAQADTVIEIGVAQHRFRLPAERVVVRCNDKVLFRVTSGDLTYGFGLFRGDNSMVFQMQVLPGHDNDILWRFDRAGVYSIRSTEYSGPAGLDMAVPDAVEVTCDATGDVSALTHDAGSRS